MRKLTGLLLLAAFALLAADGDWELLKKIYEDRTSDLAVRISKQVYKRGDRMTIEVDVPQAGYVNIIAMGTNDGAATILFPNQYAQDNHVEAGVLHIPNNGSYALIPRPTQTVEENELVVVFSTRELNLYKQGTGPGVFREMNATTRSTVVRQASGYSAGFATYQIAP